MPKWQDETFHATFIHDLTPMQVTFSTLLKGTKVLKSAGTVSDKFNSLGTTSAPNLPPWAPRTLRRYWPTDPLNDINTIYTISSVFSKYHTYLVLD